ncbi:MAG: tetratricopeptide repeat protein [Acidobacteria bacterium]|nr:tetratricopeptide repeat protein [Acidobacteriota bacterium]MCW5948989.1 tetratricopeptide repeat protein [Pyrinomonadaceae bacterium]
MKLKIISLLIVCLVAGSAAAQKLPKPTQLPTALTEAERAELARGVALHDAKKYDEAIAVYDAILKLNPDAVVAIYEKALTQYEMKNLNAAMTTAYSGAKYKSEELPLFYGIMAHCLDDVGKPDEAIAVYREAEAMLSTERSMKPHLANIYYNLGVTYVRLKKYSEARAELKKAVENNFSYPSPHYLLSVVWGNTGYKVPALMAALRFVSLEYNTGRTGPAAATIETILKPAEKGPDGKTVINLNLAAPKDEGDFGLYEMLLPTLMMVGDKKDPNKTEAEKFVGALSSLVSMIAEDKDLPKTFVGRTYVPFLAEMKKRDLVPTFGYMILFIRGNAEAKAWLQRNDDKLGRLFTFASEYVPADK